jgi:hypothetical protein
MMKILEKDIPFFKERADWRQLSYVTRLVLIECSLIQSFGDREIEVAP